MSQLFSFMGAMRTIHEIEALKSTPVEEAVVIAEEQEVVEVTPEKVDVKPTLKSRLKSAVKSSKKK